jgi:hypothetical protein
MRFNSVTKKRSTEKESVAHVAIVASNYDIRQTATIFMGRFGDNMKRCRRGLGRLDARDLAESLVSYQILVLDPIDYQARRSR